MKRFGAVLVVVLGLVGALVGSGTGAAVAAPFPSRIDLPDGFRPEGIAIGKGTTFYVGSIPTGAIYRGDLRTGDGDVSARRHGERRDRDRGRREGAPLRRRWRDRAGTGRGRSNRVHCSRPTT